MQSFVLHIFGWLKKKNKQVGQVNNQLGCKQTWKPFGVIELLSLWPVAGLLVRPKGYETEN